MMVLWFWDDGFGIMALAGLVMTVVILVFLEDADSDISGMMMFL